MKKFLSLVLALVMTMSLVTVSAGAKDFTDNSKINYKEAVDVMSAVKVIDGYTDGSFNPSATLTRGAAAKIMADKKNLCAQIDIALHNRVTEEKDRLEMTTSQYIASLLTEYYKMKDENAGHLGWRSHDLRHHGIEAAGGSAR